MEQSLEAEIRLQADTARVSAQTTHERNSRFRRIEYDVDESICKSSQSNPNKRWKPSLREQTVDQFSPFLMGVGEELTLTSCKEKVLHPQELRMETLHRKHSCDDYKSGVNTLRHRFASSPWQGDQKHIFTTHLLRFVIAFARTHVYNPHLLDNRSTSSNVRKAGAQVSPLSCLDGEPHGWVPVDTHSTPVPSSTWEAVVQEPNTPQEHAQHVQLSFIKCSEKELLSKKRLPQVLSVKTMSASVLPGD